VTSPTTRMASTEASRGPGRPDPRVAQTKQLVLAAAFAVISESGFAGATVERIAERSGVARSSIYRHWPSPLPTLHMEALAPLQQRPEDISRTGDARHDLLEVGHFPLGCRRVPDGRYWLRESILREFELPASAHLPPPSRSNWTPPESRRKSAGREPSVLASHKRHAQSR